MFSLGALFFVGFIALLVGIYIGAGIEAKLQNVQQKIVRMWVSRIQANDGAFYLDQPVEVIEERGLSRYRFIEGKEVIEWVGSTGTNQVFNLTVKPYHESKT